MPSANKNKGDRFERAVQDHIQANGFPWCEKTRAGYARDHGDLHLDPVTRHVIAQAKNHARLALPEWLAQLEQQTAESGARHGFLIVKRRGLTDPGRSYAVMELDPLLRLVRAAGYGTPLDADDLPAATPSR
jgi:hypothetical protein